MSRTNCETLRLERDGRFRHFKPSAKGKWDVLVPSTIQVSIGDRIRVTAGFREGKNVFKNNDIVELSEVTDTELVLHDGAANVMRAIKKAIDPDNIMNFCGGTSILHALSRVVLANPPVSMHQHMLCVLKKRSEPPASPKSFSLKIGTWVVIYAHLTSIPRSRVTSSAAGFAATSLGTRIVNAQTKRNKGAPRDAVDQMQHAGACMTF